jgi:hypothetical protein
MRKKINCHTAAYLHKAGCKVQKTHFVVLPKSRKLPTYMARQIKQLDDCKMEGNKGKWEDSVTGVMY